MERDSSIFAGTSSAQPPEFLGVMRGPDGAARAAGWASFLNEYSTLILHAVRASSNGYDDTMDRYTFVLDKLSADSYQKLRSYRPTNKTKFSTWLVVVARRLCIDYHRSRYGRPRDTDPTPRRETVSHSRKNLVDFVAAKIDVANIADRFGQTPEWQLRSRQLYESLDRALEALAPRDRLLLQLRFEDDVPVREIKDLLKMPSPFHVYRSVNRLLKQLRETLEADGVWSAAP